MHVIIVRHGIAHDRLDPACPPDPERALTPEGVKKTAQAARGLARLELTPLAHFASPYVRAQQTAALFREALARAGDPERPLHTTDALLPDADPLEILREVAPYTDDVALYGHAPHLDRMAALLTGAPERAFSLKKAGIVVVRFLEHPGERTGELIALLPPKALRLIADARG